MDPSELSRAEKADSIARYPEETGEKCSSESDPKRADGAPLKVNRAPASPRPRRSRAPIRRGPGSARARAASVRRLGVVRRAKNSDSSGCPGSDDPITAVYRAIGRHSGRSPRRVLERTRAPGFAPRCRLPRDSARSSRRGGSARESGGACEGSLSTGCDGGAASRTPSARKRSIWSPRSSCLERQPSARPAWQPAQSRALGAWNVRSRPMPAPGRRKRTFTSTPPCEAKASVCSSFQRYVDASRSRAPSARGSEFSTRRSPGDGSR